VENGKDEERMIITQTTEITEGTQCTEDRM
jgi:hypothetical protein